MKIEVALILLITVFPLFAQEEAVQITLDAPENVVAGNDIKVVLTFNKGDLRDYSRFSQELPLGFTATNLSSPNADFTFTDQRVRIIWLKLPSEPTLRIVYLISVHERLSGQLELGGTFAYVNDGERAFIDVPDIKSINIQPNPDIDPELVVDISEFPNIIDETNLKPDESLTELTPPEPEKEFFALAIRQNPVVDADGNVTVNLLVKRPENTDFLKLEEYIPSGYSFESLMDNGAVVSQSSSIARYVWMSVPSEETFMLQYRLIPIPGEQQGEMVVEGNMTYTEDGNSKVESIREVDEDLELLTERERQNILNTGSADGTVLAENPGMQGGQGKEDIQEEQGDQVTDNNSMGGQGSEGEAVAGSEDAAGTQTTESTTTTPVNKTVSAEDDKNYGGVYVKTRLKKIIKIEPLEEMEGVYYRVQIGAIKKPYFARVVYAEYDILRDVKAEYIDIWHKFTLGSFNSYQEATAFKSRVLTETPTESAFIVAYKDGNRVPISEVL